MKELFHRLDPEAIANGQASQMSDGQLLGLTEGTIALAEADLKLVSGGSGCTIDPIGRAAR